MPAVSKQTAPQVVSVEGFEGRLADVDGYTIAFETYTRDGDPAEMFKGLPGDRCPCPHWGYVLSGRLTLVYEDREEVAEAGHAYYAAPGHLPKVAAGTEVVQFSPSDELAKTTAVVMQNFQEHIARMNEDGS